MNANGSLRQTNAFAMQYGLWLGLAALVAFAAFIGSFALTSLSSLFMLLALSMPVLAVLFTLRFRRAVAGMHGPFSFWHGMGHTLLMTLYSSVWLAVGVYAYFAWMDGGFFFDAYLQMLRRPDVQEALRQSPLLQGVDTGAGSVDAEELVEAMRGIGAAGYSALAIYLSMLGGIPLAVVAGLVTCRRGTGAC